MVSWLWMLVSLLIVAVVYGAFVMCLVIAGRGDTAELTAALSSPCHS